ncbi:MAG: hypothetical protein LBQ42_13255 [Synergistaceae bacterium]|jgi:hypothetical protein|nr:hypothetical protein [Synergistaceae bacterium]
MLTRRVLTIIFAVFCIQLYIKECESSEGNWINYAVADFAGGNGTKEDPYRIDSPKRLARLAYIVNEQIKDQYGIEFSDKYYELSANIDLNGREWTPIGYSA